MLTINEEIKKICEDYFLPLCCVADILENYGNAVKLTVLDENRKKIMEQKILLSEVCDDRQEIDREKLEARLNSIKKRIYTTRKF